MPAAATHPRPVSRAAFDVFAKDDPIGAQMVLNCKRVEIVEQKESGHQYST
ncbi:MAG: hypothetical protein ACYDDV_00445 [Methanoregula sp.]